MKKLVENKMNLNTELEQNEFKVVIKQFTKYYQKIVVKLDDGIKTC